MEETDAIMPKNIVHRNKFMAACENTGVSSVFKIAEEADCVGGSMILSRHEKGPANFAGPLISGNPKRAYLLFLVTAVMLA